MAARNVPLDHQNVTLLASSPEGLGEMVTGAKVSEGRESQGTQPGGELSLEE